MKTFRIHLFLLCCLTACTHFSDIQSSLNVWRSSNATPQERAIAVSQLIPKGAKLAQVKEILGRGGQWTRRYGPILGNGPAQSFFDQTTWDYKVNGGWVILEMEIPSGTSAWEIAKYKSVKYAISEPGAIQD